MLITLSAQGALEGGVGDFGSAATRYQQAVEIVRESGDRDLLGAHLSALGLALYQTGDRERARVYAEEANEISRESGNRIWGAALALIACALDEGRALTRHDLSTDLSPLLGVEWMGRLLLVVLAHPDYSHSEILQNELIHVNDSTVVWRAEFSRRARDGYEIERLGGTYFNASGEFGPRIWAIGAHS
jgi:tetratricopeptide (TPR) repeat protein